MISINLKYSTRYAWEKNKQILAQAVWDFGCTYWPMQNDEYHSVISWDSDGERILIKDQLKMDAEIIPVYFSLRKFSSFVRQLHLYDFHKEKSTNSVLMFRNTFFKRDQR